MDREFLTTPARHLRPTNRLINVPMNGRRDGGFYQNKITKGTSPQTLVLRSSEARNMWWELTIGLQRSVALQAAACGVIASSEWYRIYTAAVAIVAATRRRSALIAAATL